MKVSVEKPVDFVSASSWYTGAKGACKPLFYRTDRDFKNFRSISMTSVAEALLTPRGSFQTPQCEIQEDKQRVAVIHFSS